MRLLQDRGRQTTVFVEVCDIVHRILETCDDHGITLHVPWVSSRLNLPDGASRGFTASKVETYKMLAWMDMLLYM